MSIPEVVSPAQWRESRVALLAEEKALSRALDAVAAKRRSLPAVEITKDYVFEGENGKARLLDLFDGRDQLIVYHFMWRWDIDAGCPSCSTLLDNVGHLSHIHRTGTSLVAVSRGPWPNLRAFVERMGWSVPFYSSFGTDFNYDFHVTLDESVTPVEYNFRTKEELIAAGQPWATEGELPGVSVFVRDGDRILHTYSAYTRGVDLLIGTFNWLDLTPSGRTFHIGEAIHHDRYDTDTTACH